MSQQPMDGADLAEMRRLRIEAAAKRRELEELENAMDRLCGVSQESDRPKKPRMSAKDFAARCQH